MKKISKQDLIVFLNSKQPPKKVNEKNIQQVLYFSLVWNSFEGNFFFDHVELNNGTLCKLADNFSSLIEERFINQIFEEFRKRYTKDNTIENKFNALKFCYKNTQSNQEAEMFVKKSLLATNPTKEAKLKTVLLIIYRFRNNMFHGRKTTLSLSLYEQIFGYINQFLIHLVTALIDYKKNVRRTLSS